MDVKQKRTIKPSTGERYAICKFRVKALLRELGVLKVIDEKILEKLCNKWLKLNLAARMIVIEYLSNAFLNFAKDKQHANDKWGITSQVIPPQKTKSSDRA